MRPSEQGASLPSTGDQPPGATKDVQEDRLPGVTPLPEGALTLLDLVAVRRWAVLTRSLFAARRTEIDALNVFPVPDGDTGTNLYLTFDGAVERTLAGDEPGSAGGLLTTFARHLLWTARGNSGVILSQLARGLAEECDAAARIDGPMLAEGLRRADVRAREAVTDPKEGTILSVARAMAEAAESAVAGGLGGLPSLGDLADEVTTPVHVVASAALAAAQQALARTPSQLDVLARAGVVDAGGAGLVVLLEALERVCAGQRGRQPLEGTDRRTRLRPGRTVPGLAGTHPPGASGGAASPEFEVMYLLRDSSDAAVDRLRARLVELGDSVLVVGGEGDWNIHAHVDDAGAAVEAGIEAGRPHRVRITRLLDEHGPDVAAHAAVGNLSAEPAPERAAMRCGVVACAAGVGLESLFEDIGAVVVRSGPGRRASTGGLIDAIRAQHARGAAGVVVLPNDGDTLLAAAAAARAVADDGIEAHVVHVRTAVQGIAACAVFEPTATAADNVLAMQAAASATRHGAVTVANRAALTSGGPCRPGDVLGVVDGDVVIVGSDELAVTREVVRRLLGSGGELVTLVAGADAPGGLFEAVTAEARATHHGVEVTLVDGGQAIYSVLVGVE
jgi:DAK2 domain fusion protein YloV